MTYDYITKYTSPHQNARPGKPRFIVIHYWGDRGQKFQNVVNFLCDPKRTKNRTSAHYVAEGGRVACIVDPDRRAWHAGSSYGNDYGIGIECRPEATDADYATVAELVASLRTVYGDLPLKPHKAFTSTDCPGPWNLARIDRLARGVSAGPSAGHGTAAPTPAGKLAVDGRAGTATVAELQGALGVTRDGRAAEATWSALQRKLATPVDGVVSHQSYRADELGNGIVPRAWRCDGRGARGSAMVRALQSHLGVTPDGIWYEGTTRALQAALNAGRF